MASLKEYRDARLNKLKQLRKMGVDPYPAKSNRTTDNAKIIGDFQRFDGKQVVVAGRILSFREHGQLAFIDVKDASGKIQLYIKSDELAAARYANSELSFVDLALLDPGDFVEAKGTVVKTKAGEVSVQVKTIRILAKSIRPLPNQWAGLKDKETRLRRRYLDTNINQDVYERFIRRSKFWQATREFLNNNGFIEINIPVLEHTTGGADAKPFKTHMDAINQDFYLRISHELPLKRLIGGGYDRVFDIGPRFRNENYSDEHLPEHVAFESYAAYQDYMEGMQMYEQMMKEVAQATWGKLQFSINGFDVNLDQKWPIVSYADVMRERFKIDVFHPDFDQLKSILKENKVKLEGEVGPLRAMDSVWKLIRKESPGPFWLIGEPISISPLAKQDPLDPRVSQRFHPVIAGTEMGNGYSELNDPLDQLNRFMEQQELRDAGDEEAQMLDIDFVEMLEYGMPPACGWSYSERFFWMFEGVTAREGVPFPQLRHEVDDVTKAIYPEVFKQGKAQIVKKSQDFSKRFVAVVDSGLEPWQVANAVSHSIGYLSNCLPKEQFVSGETFETQDGLELPRNSQYAMITKKAKQKDLHKLLSTLKDEPDVLYHVFVADMQETTDDAELEKRLGKQSNEDLRIYGIAMFGDNDAVSRLTKPFQLYS
jgi:lysyl-tRNA synthetase, class II